MKTIGIVCALVAMCVVGSAVAGVVVEDRPCSPPRPWKQLGAPDAQHLITLTVAVKQSNLEQLEELVLRVSDPANTESYGKHWSQEQVNALVAPAAADVEAVMTWITSVAPDAFIQKTTNGDFVMALVTVAQAEALLGAKYAMYAHKDTGMHAVRLVPGSVYRVPAAVAGAIDFVAPTTRFPASKANIHSNPALQKQRELMNEAALQQQHNKGNGSFIIVPGFLRELYQAQDAFGTAGVNNVQCVASFIQQFYSADDLQEFYGLFFPVMKNHTIAKQIGKNDPTNVGAEAELDTQYLSSVGAKVDTWVWYTGSADTPFLSWLIDVSNTTTIPNLFSVSYGEYENGNTKAYAVRVSTEFQKLGARGVSVLMAAGDSGAGGNCTSSGRYSPDFPATSPWVTTVGGMIGGDAGKTPTGETTDYISGGGFSDFFPRPKWQDAAVAHYFANDTKLPPAAVYNRSGRGYPDVAAQSEAFTIVLDRVPILGGVGGTSCATPTVGGIFSLLNDRRIAAGKAPLGYLNPLIYSVAASTPNAFNDATYGANMGCNSFTGFTAAPGWDPTTGWGSPNYRILSGVVDSLP